MPDVTIYHNPHCHASQNALTIADGLGVDYDVVLYLKVKPDRDFAPLLPRLAVLP